jgi:NAD(P)-dependent dehydrogenase (short-subunit alcohol dehydrogenase family)
MFGLVCCSSADICHEIKIRIVVTGASSGVGLGVTKRALVSGDIVVATLRKPTNLDELSSKYPESQLLVLKVDVTNNQEVTSAFACAVEAFGRIDIVFNNAGTWMRAKVEYTPDADARRLHEVNFWGSLQVTREAIKVFHDVNPKGHGGHLVQNASMVAVDAWPLTGLYSSTKYGEVNLHYKTFIIAEGSSYGRCY